MDFDEALLSFKAHDYFVWKHFLNAEEMREVLNDFRAIREQNQFKLAGTGNHERASQVKDQIRSDETYWFEPEALSSAQKLIWEKLERLKNELNAHFYFGLWSLEGHYSHYPVGGYYHRHLDQIRGDDTRMISVVLYLNQDWQPEHAGQLRIFRPEGDPAHVDIDPIAGDLVCFLSESTPHEVLRTSHARLSFAGWWKRRSSAQN